MAEIGWLDAIPAAVFLVRDQQVIFANQAAAHLIGCGQQELAGASLADFLKESRSGECLISCGNTVIYADITRAPVEHEGAPAQLVTLQPRNPARLLRTVVESGTDNFFLLRMVHGAGGAITDFVIEDANERAIATTPLTREQLVGNSVREILPETTATPLVQAFARMVESGKPFFQEMNISDLLIKDGWYEIQVIPLEDDRVAVFHRDITERKEGEEIVQNLALEVEQQARLLDEMLSAAPDAFILFDRAGHYLYVNRRGLEDAGLTVDQVSGKTWRELGFPEEAGILFEERLRHVFSTGKSLTYEEQFPTLTGLRDFLTTLTPIHDNDGNVIFMLNTIHDITERKNAEREQQKLSAELEQQARVFDEVLSTTPDNFLMIDRQGKFLYASPSSLRNVSLTPQQVVGKTWRELGFPEEAGKSADQMMAHVFATGESSIEEATFPTVAGLRSFETIYSPLHDKTGEVVAVVITNHDITERKQIEEALRDNQRLFGSIFDTTLVGIAVVNADGLYVSVNRTYCDLYGYAPEDLTGRHFTEIVSAENREHIIELHRRFMSGEPQASKSEWTMYRKDGSPIEILAYNSLLLRENGERLRIVAIVDVTPQKQAQRALEDSEQRLTSILNSMEDAVWSVRLDTRELFYVNPAIEAVTGYSADEFTVNQRLLTEIVHPDDRERFETQLRQVQEGARVDTEYRIMRRDGALRWIRNRFWIVSAAEGHRIDGIMADITDRREAEAQRLQLAVERERVRILSDFVRDASHEFRTPLSVINTRLYLLEKVNDPHKQADYIEGIREQAERILKLVESLITMSQLDSASEIHAERIDLNQVLTMLNLNTALVAQRKGVFLTLELSPEALYVQGEMDKLITAFKAIFDNALSYTPRGGIVTIHSRRLNDQEVVVDVRDTGLGISKAELPHIFERFYRVDSARSLHGFGLGLPIARKVLEMHQGRIEVESTPQSGSLFRLILPADRRESDAAAL